MHADTIRQPDIVMPHDNQLYDDDVKPSYLYNDVSAPVLLDLSVHVKLLGLGVWVMEYSKLWETKYYFMHGTHPKSWNFAIVAQDGQ